MPPLRTGIIGCGSFARQHALRLQALEQVSLAAFCNRTIEKAVAFNQEFAGGRALVFDDCAQMFEGAGLDLVYICLPPYAHGREVEFAAANGAHIFIEKPIALSLDLAQDMARHVRTAGVKCQVGFHYRFGSAVLQLRHHLATQPPGRAAFMTASYACNSLHSPWWRDRAKSGGQLVEQAIHLVDLTRFFLGEAVEVYGAQDNLFHAAVPGYTAEDAGAAIIRFQSGSMAVVSATNGAVPGRWEYDWRVAMPGLVADFTHPNEAVFQHTGSDPVTSRTVTGEKDLYLAETLDLLDAIRYDRPAAVPIEEGVRSLQLVLAASESAAQNRPVSLQNLAL
jgi:predicted dehydrogenase